MDAIRENQVETLGIKNRRYEECLLSGSSVDDIIKQKKISDIKNSVIEIK